MTDEKLVSLHASMHPMAAQMWVRLGEAYAKVYPASGAFIDDGLYQIDLTVDNLALLLPAKPVNRD